MGPMGTSRSVLLVLLVLAAVGLACLPVCADMVSPWFTFTELGMVESRSASMPYCINDRGQTAGQATSSTGYYHAVRYDVGATTPTDLGTLGGNYSVAKGINAGGQVVGYSLLTGNAAAHAVRWNSDGTATDLGTLPGGTYSDARAVNDSGWVVGMATLPSDAQHAVRWNGGGTPIDLGTIGGVMSYAQAINASGQVAGRAETAARYDHAVRWDSDGTPTDLGTLGGGRSEAFGINDGGWVVGNSLTTGNAMTHAVRWDSYGTATDLGTLGGTYTYSNAYDINSSGWTVGISREAGVNAQNVPVLWIDNEVFDLRARILGGTGSWMLREARGINESGQIVGFGIDPDGHGRGFLLTPQNQGPADVPEPSTLALLSSGAVFGIGLLRRRRKQ